MDFNNCPAWKPSSLIKVSTTSHIPRGCRFLGMPGGFFNKENPTLIFLEGIIFFYPFSPLFF